MSIHLIGQDFLTAESRCRENESTIKYEKSAAHFPVKRYMMSDLQALRNLIDSKTHMLFGNISINDVVGLNYLTLVTRNLDGKIVASMSVNNYPNLWAICCSDWPTWLNKLYKIRTLNIRNTMWIHLYLFARKSITIFKKLIKEVYLRHAHVQYIAMIIPPKCRAITRWLDQFGKRVVPRKFHLNDNVQNVFIIERHDFIHQYKLRRACQEDNDDILPLIDQNAPQFKEIYGTFYPAFLAKKTTSGRNMIIAEFGGKVVAVLCLNGSVALEYLKDHYELETYYGLHKIQTQPVIQESTSFTEELYGSMISMHSSLNETERENLQDRERRLKNLYDPDALTIESQGFNDSTEEEENILSTDDSFTYESLMSLSSSKSMSSSMDATVGSDWLSVRAAINFDVASFTDSDDDDDESIELDFKLNHDSSESNSTDSMTLPHQEEDTISKLSRQKKKQREIKFSIGSGTSMLVDEAAKDSAEEKSTTDQGSLKYNIDESEIEIFSSLDHKYGPLALSASMQAMRKSQADIYLSSLSRTSYQMTEGRPSDYQGDCNCFVIEIAVAAPGHETALQQLVACCFQCYPKKDYCILTIPTIEDICPMMEMFVRISPRAGAIHKDDMYLAYRGAFVGDIRVRRANNMDIFAMEDLVYTTYSPDELAWFVRESLHRHVNEIFVFMCDMYVVGFSLLRMEKKFDYIKHHYELETYTELEMHKAGCIGRIDYLIMSPAFQQMSRFFLAEMHRISGYTLLTYYILPEDGWRYRHLAVNLADLIPVKPRKVSALLIDQSSNVNVQATLSALYISTLSLCSLPRKDINAQIVIVGNSITAMAFLETLLFDSSEQYKAIFNNVYVVSPCNSMLPMKPSKVRSYFFVRTSYFDYRYLNQLGLKTYANFITGVMTEINRTKKEIIIDDEKKLSYDYLFLFCGKQFSKPMLYKASLTGLDKIKRKKMVQFMATVEQPRNVFIVNTDDDALVALKVLKRIIQMFHVKQKNVIVYGRCLEAYCCLAALMEFGLTGPDLIFIECPLERKQQEFTFPLNVGRYMEETLVKLGITVFFNYRLYDYIWNKSTKMITAAIFETKLFRKKFECTAMFAFDNKIYSSCTFLALHNAGLVFDGGLVINTDCSTHDERIYAAGTLTKFSRRHHSDHLNHGLFSSQEVGSVLGKAIRKKLIPGYDEEKTYDLRYTWETKPTIRAQYTKPRIQYCKLPGKLFYLYLRKPGIRIPSQFLQADNAYGTELITGSFKSIQFNEGYFKLYLNEYGSVERITCVSRKHIDYFNLIQLYGKHEQMLNNLLIRFQSCTIGNLYYFFKLPWSTALYNSQYTFFESEIRKIMMSLKDEDGALLSAKLLYMFKQNKFKALHPMEFHWIKQKFIQANYHGIISQKLLIYMVNNIDFMGMYAHPIAVRNILQGFMDSPLMEKM